MDSEIRELSLFIFIPLYSSFFFFFLYTTIYEQLLRHLLSLLTLYDIYKNTFISRI